MKADVFIHARAQTQIFKNSLPVWPKLFFVRSSRNECLIIPPGTEAGGSLDLRNVTTAETQSNIHRNASEAGRGGNAEPSVFQQTPLSANVKTTV